MGEALDTAAFEALYERLLPIVYGYLLRRVGGNTLLAEDLTQETFLSAVGGLPATVQSPEAWMITIARRRFVDHLRRKGRARHVPMVGLDRAVPGWPPDWTSDERRVTLALAQVDDAQRLALTLHHVDDLPVAEVAAIIDRSISATESLLARARRSLRAAFDEVADD